MGSSSSISNYKKTIESLMLVSFIIFILCLPPFPMETFASGLSITVETNKDKYLPSQTLIVSGYVRMDGNPVADALVNVTVKAPSGETVWSTKEITDNAGFYSFTEPLPSDAPTGTYNVTVETSYISGYGVPLYANSSVTFEVVAATLEEVKIGVYGPGETPIANASVILYDHLSGEWVNDAKTNGSGIAVMNVSTAIAFDVLIYKTGYGRIEDGRVIGFYFDSNSTTGYVAPCNVNFTLQSGIDSGVLSGVVSDAVNGSAVAGATVSVSAYIRGKTYFVRSATTLSNGSYSIDLNVGTWKVWIDKKVNGETVYLGTWSDAQVTAGATVTLNMSLWPKAKLTIKSLTSTDTQEIEEAMMILINDTYGGMIWQANFLTIDLPKDFDVPAINSLAVFIAKGNESLYLGSVEISLEGGGNTSVSPVLYQPEYVIWCFPNDWEMHRLLGNLTLETFVVTPETAMPKGPDGGGPPQFVDPDGSISQYIMLDLGGGIPTTWRNMTTPTRTEVGSYFGFFDLDALGAPQGYYIAFTLIRNSTGDAVAASLEFFNRFQYQIQPLKAKGIYDVGEDVEVKFKVYGSSGYVSNVEVSYKLFDDQWNFIEGGFATVNSTTKVWNVTLPSSIFSMEKYHLSIKISGGKEYTFDFRVQDYTPVTFSGQILPYASIDLISPEYGTFIVTANQTGFFSIKMFPGEYDAWFHYDNKDTPGWDARDTSIYLTLTSDVTNFPDGFYGYLERPMQPVFEVRGIAFNDTNRNGIWDPGEDRLALVNVRGINVSGWEEWVPPTFPDGMYRLFLKPDTIYKLRATKTVYMQNETATPEVGEGTSQGDLLIVNIPMVKMYPAYITGYVKLDNGTLLENVGLHFMDEYWTWIGSTFTNSTGGYLFTAPANKKMNIWVDPMRPGVQGREIRDVTVSEGETMILNITLYRSARINGTIQMNGMDVSAQILPLDKDWNRVWWDWGETGYFETELPLSVERLMIWTWESGFLIRDVSLVAGNTTDLGIIDLNPTDPDLMVDAHPKDWEWEWSVGHYVNFTVELRDAAKDWEPISGANVTYWAWYWDTGEIVGHGTINETEPGIYEGSFLAEKAGHYRVFILANVTASPSRINFNDFWISATDKKMYLIECRGEYSLADVQSGDAEVLVKLLNASDGSPISGFDVWYEIRGFVNITTWEMETVVTRTSATDLGGGVYRVTLPKILGEGEYWMEIVAGEWEASEHVGFYIAKEPKPTVNIYGYVTRSPAPVEGAIIETWMEGMPYLYVTTTNASGYYSLPVPEKNAYHMHIYYDNATTTGIDYTTMPEWERVEVKVLDVYHNASLAKVEEVSLTIFNETGIPIDADILVWDVSETPYTLTLWTGTWMGPGLFKEKIAEGQYIFEIRKRDWGWPQPAFWTDPKTITAGPPPESFNVTMPKYDIVGEVWADTGGVWRAKPGANITLMIYEQELQEKYGLNASYLLNNCEKRFEVFNWIPGKMGRGFAYNVTWTLKEKNGEKFLAANFTIPEYIAGGDVEIQAAFYNYSNAAPQKIFVLATNHLIITPLDLGLTVVPFSVSVGDQVMAVAVVMSSGAPATGVEVAFEIYNETWSLVDTLEGTEIAPGVYSVTFTVPEGYGEGWWTVKAIATVAGKEATAYEGFNVSPG